MIKGITIVLIAFFLIGFAFAGEFSCYKDTVTYNDNVASCIYKPDNTEYYDPQIYSQKGIDAKLDYIEKFINSNITLDIVVDIANSSQGKQIIEIEQSNRIYEVEINVDKGINEEITSTVNYLDNYIELELVLPNLSNKDRLAIVQVTDKPSELKVRDYEKTLVLMSGKTNTVKIRFDYTNSTDGQIKIEIKESDKTTTVISEIQKTKFKISSNGLNPLFTLANTKTVLVLDVALFIVAITLFTMFVGRVGNIIHTKK